jgi:hypothetical protein
MEPISATLAGIQLVSASVKFIKERISDCKDIGEIAGQIDSLFVGQKQVQEASNRKSGVGIADQFGVQSVAKEMINAKLAAEKLQEVATMVDMRFGPGTWKGIVDERAKRIQEAKEAAIAARRKARLEHEQTMAMVKNTLIVCCCIAVAMGLAIFMFITIAQASTLLI